MANHWIETCKAYQKKHGCSYKNALIACSGKKAKTKTKKQKGGLLPLLPVLGLALAKGVVSGAAAAGASYGVNRAIRG